MSAERPKRHRSETTSAYANRLRQQGYTPDEINSFVSASVYDFAATGV